MRRGVPRRHLRHSLADAGIAKLPASPDRIIGKRFRKSADLSGGKRQKDLDRPSRARMRHTQLLILGESTASPATDPYTGQYES